MRRTGILKILLDVFMLVVVATLIYHDYQVTQEYNQIRVNEENSMVLINDLNHKNEQLILETDKLKNDIETLNQEKEVLNQEKISLENELENIKRQKTPQISRGGKRHINVEATAYVLGGNTATGFSLSGHTRESAMVIAVDPNIIPLGSQVYVEFDDAFSHYNGIYTASDTGGGIRGHIIDVFVGHGNMNEAMNFGRRTAKVYFI